MNDNQDIAKYLKFVIWIVFFAGIAWSSISQIKSLEYASSQTIVRISVLETQFTEIDKKLENIEKKMDRIIYRK